MPAGWVPPPPPPPLLTVLVILTRGIVRLVRERGVTVQAVAGALTTYLLIGLEFALVVRVIVGISPHPYFEQVTNAAVTQSQEIYFSFTTLTTTGYGDLSPVLSVGRTLSVLEMLIGQIYLVTVIGLLVGNLRRSPERRAGGDRSLGNAEPGASANPPPPTATTRAKRRYSSASSSSSSSSPARFAANPRAAGRPS